MLSIFKSSPSIHTIHLKSKQVSHVRFYTNYETKHIFSQHTDTDISLYFAPDTLWLAPDTLWQTGTPQYCPPQSLTSCWAVSTHGARHLMSTTRASLAFCHSGASAWLGIFMSTSRVANTFPSISPMPSPIQPCLIVRSASLMSCLGSHSTHGARRLSFTTRGQHL